MPTSRAFATLKEGSAGGRGGGTGLICRSAKFAVPIEEHLMPRASIHIPEDRQSIEKEWLKQRLSFDSKLHETLLKKWKEIGEYDSWDPITLEDLGKTLAEGSIDGYRDLFDELKKSLPANANPSPKRVDDDYFTTPAGCEKVQLAFFADGSVHRILEYTLTERSKRILELHEAFFLAGMESYGQEFPFETQDLIVALNGGAAKTIRRAARAFTSDEPDADEWKVRPDRSRIVEGIYELISSHSMEIAECPRTIAVIYANDGMRITYLYSDSASGYSVSHRSGESTRVQFTSRAGKAPKQVVWSSTDSDDSRSNTVDLFFRDGNRVTLNRLPRSEAKMKKDIYGAFLSPELAVSRRECSYSLSTDLFYHGTFGNPDRHREAISIFKAWNAWVSSLCY